MFVYGTENEFANIGTTFVSNVTDCVYSKTFEIVNTPVCFNTIVVEGELVKDKNKSLRQKQPYFPTTEVLHHSHH